VAEFVGGGISPVYRIDIIRLTRVMDFSGYMVTTCEVLFVFATFYYVLNSISSLKAMGPSAYFKEAWNIVDIFTIFFSVFVIILWVFKNLAVLEMTKKISKTGGNAFVPIEKTMQINSYFDYTVSITVFTSMLKFCRLLRFYLVYCMSYMYYCVSVSKRLSSKLLQPSSFASSAFPHLLWNS
jgi:hypothetical protein